MGAGCWLSCSIRWVRMGNPWYLVGSPNRSVADIIAEEKLKLQDRRIHLSTTTAPPAPAAVESTGTLWMTTWNPDHGILSHLEELDQTFTQVEAMAPAVVEEEEELLNRSSLFWNNAGIPCRQKELLKYLQNLSSIRLLHRKTVFKVVCSFVVKPWRILL